MKPEQLAMIRHNAAGAVREVEKLRALVDQAQTVMRTLDAHISVLNIEPNETASVKKSKAKGNRNSRPASPRRNRR